MDTYPEPPQHDRRTFLRFLSIGAGSLLLPACSTTEARGSDEPTEPADEPAPATKPAEASEAAAPEKYARHDNITTTVFWIGEAADEDNDFISNVPTAWDEDASKRYGGYDGSNKPHGKVSDTARDENGVTTEFHPKHNPFYFALPAGEFNESGLIEGARERSPWADETLGEGESLFKGRWMKITAGDKTAYAQWLDVGPNEEKDYDYVFGDGTQKPKNEFNLKAGLDVSPATAKVLGFDDGGIEISWQFVDTDEVADGPWKEYTAIDNKTHWS